MVEFFRKLFSSQDFMPHGHCYLWNAGPFWLTVVSDLLIATAYFSIPAFLYFILKRKPDLKFRKIFALFATFIFLCGATHVLSVVGMWEPLYRLEGVVKLATGLVSAFTAVTLAFVVPKALAIPEELQRTRQRLTVEEDERRKAIAANNMKSRFLSTMSHEIRNPMYGITGALDILEAQRMEATQREIVALARESCQRLVLMLNDVLDLSKAEAGRLQLVEEPFLVQELIEGCTQLLMFQAEAKGVQLRSRIEPDVPGVVVGDKGRLGQVLVNLMTNAVKFTPRGWVETRVRVEGVRDRLVDLAIEVEDTGVGISPANLQQIFEAFAQERPSTARDFGGTGLGLAIAKQFIQAMNGQIEAKSEPGRGSCFTIRLPLVAAGEGVSASIVRSRSMQQHNLLETRTDRPLRVLVVEDAPLNQEITSRVLEERGHVAEVVGQASEVMPRLEQGDFDVVILDIVIGDDSGLEVARAIRAHARPRLAALPILGFTAETGEENERAARRAGMNAYLTKPVLATHLLEALEGIARKASPGVTSGRTT